MTQRREEGISRGADSYFTHVSELFSRLYILLAGTAGSGGIGAL